MIAIKHERTRVKARKPKKCKNIDTLNISLPLNPVHTGSSFYSSPLRNYVLIAKEHPGVAIIECIGLKNELRVGTSIPQYLMTMLVGRVLKTFRIDPYPQLNGEQN